MGFGGGELLVRGLLGGDPLSQQHETQGGANLGPGRRRATNTRNDLRIYIRSRCAESPISSPGT